MKSLNKLISLSPISLNMDVVEHLKLEDFLKNSAIFITLITAFFYCSSMVYTHAYLGRLGLDSDVLERSFHAVVYQGFMFNLQIMTIGTMFVVGLVCIRVILIIEVRRSIRTDIKIARKILRFKWAVLKFCKIKRRSFDYFERPYITGAANVSMVSLLLLCMLLVLARFEIKGAKVADRINKSITSQLKEKAINNGSIAKADIQHPSIITPSQYTPDNSLMFLYCGSRMCAGFDFDKEHIVYFSNASFTFKQGQLSK